MRSTILILCTAAFFLSSCASLEVKRYVREDNVFYSSALPSIQVKVSDDFKYEELDESESSEFIDYSGGLSTAEEKSESYLFKEKNSDNRSILIIISRILNPDISYRSPLFHCNESIECGDANLNGEIYQYEISSFERGSQTFLVKSYGNLVGGSNNVICAIMYFDKVKGSWKNVKQLTEDQKARLKRFNEDCDKAFKVL